MTKLMQNLIERFGNDSQKERSREGLLPKNEAIDAIREKLFEPAEIAGFHRYRHFKRDVVCAEHEQAVKVTSTEDDVSLSGENFNQLKRLRTIFADYPGVQVIPRRHTGECGTCGQKLQRKAALVMVEIDGVKISREYKL